MAGFSGVGFSGMDPDAVDAFAGKLISAADSLDRSKASLAGAIDDFVSFARGAVIGRLNQESSDVANARLSRMSKELRDLGELARREADQQRNASGNGSAKMQSISLGAAGAWVLLTLLVGGGAALWTAKEEEAKQKAYEEANGPPVSKEVSDYYNSLDTSEKKKLLQKYADRLAEDNKLPKLKVYYEDLNGANGEYHDHEDKIIINNSSLKDPDALGTLVHEMRHHAQHRAVHEYEESQGRTTELKNRLRVSDHDLKKWKEQFHEGKYIRHKDDWRKYYAQEVESDANAEKRKAKKALTVEYLKSL